MEREVKATQPVMPKFEEYIAEIRSIWDTKEMTNNGDKVKRFREMLRVFTKSEQVELFVNGHSSLMLAVKALHLHGEVITSPFTFISTTNAIIQNGLIPVFGDIDDSYNLSPRSVERLITNQTCAIITPHIFGIPCDVQGIDEIAQKHGLKVIYDAAQAFGTKINGTDISCFGDITMFSFHAVKVFNSIEGGMLAYRDGRLKKTFELYRNFGISHEENETDVDVVGINAKMNEFQAAMGIVNLSHLEEEIKKRKHLANLYRECLKEIPGISTYDYKDYIDYNYAYFPIKVTEAYGMSRDELWFQLKEHGIGTRKLYDKLTCEYRCYCDKKYARDTAYADQVKREALDLPLYGTLADGDIELVCEIIKKVRK